MDSQTERPIPHALVTGASSGIGEAFARILASRGYRITLVARRSEKLETLANELEATCGAEAIPLTADLSLPEDIWRVSRYIQEQAPVTLLINNAGFGWPGPFHEVDAKRHEQMVRVHCEAPILLTRAALPAMLTQGRGGIINVASIAGLMPEVGGPMYGSTKACVVVFTRQLRARLRDTGVRLQALCPGLVHTEFHNREGYEAYRAGAFPRWLWMSATDVAVESLEALTHDRAIVVPGLRYRLLLAMVNNPVGRAIVDRYTDRAAGG